MSLSLPCWPCIWSPVMCCHSLNPHISCLVLYLSDFFFHPSISASVLECQISFCKYCMNVWSLLFCKLLLIALCLWLTMSVSECKQFSHMFGMKDANCGAALMYFRVYLISSALRELFILVLDYCHLMCWCCNVAWCIWKFKRQKKFLLYFHIFVRS